MKRLATCFSRLFMLIIFSTFVLNRELFDLHLFKTSSIVTNEPVPIIFALAQEYSAIEGRVYIAESYIGQDGRQKDREYARLDSYAMSNRDSATEQNKQKHAAQQHQEQFVAQQYHKQRIDQPNQQAQQHPLLNERQTAQFIDASQSAPLQTEEQTQHHQEQSQPEQVQHQGTHQHYNPAHLASLSGHSNQDGQSLAIPYKQQQEQHPYHQSFISQHQESSPLSPNQHQHQQQMEDMQQVLSSQQAGKRHINGQIVYAHSQIEWRRESTGDGELNEFYLRSYHESTASYHDHLIAVENQLTYFQQHQQVHQDQNSLHHHHQQQQQQQQQQQHHHHNHHNHQQFDNQQPITQKLVDEVYQYQRQQFMYARQINDEHDYEEAEQYYSRPAVAAHHSSSCESSDDPSILILQDQYQPTCRTATVLGTVDPATAAAQATTDSFNAHGPSRNSNVESFPLAPQHYHYESSLMAAIRHYWREVGGLCIASAIFLNWLFVVVKRKIIGASESLSAARIENMSEALIQQQTSIASTGTTKSPPKDTNNTNSAHDSAFEENVSPLSLDDADSLSQTQSSSLPEDKSTGSLKSRKRRRSNSPVLRQRSSTLKADALNCASSGHASLSQSTSISTTVSNTSEYISRYSSDFDSIRRLGRGGFGIVFEARNKIDDCHYAVKRICLPLEKEARERVMREVRALAKLDHAGIVRYYNAWLETPPDDWLKQHDAQLGIVHSRDGLSFPSTDGIYDRGESEIQQTRGVSGESGDLTSDWFGTNNKNPSKYRRTNGYNSIKFLRNNSSSPSLDIVFEGSGSIRLEAENSTKQTDPNKNRHKSKNIKQQKSNKNNGDTNNSDSEDSDFIQFKSKGNDGPCNAINDFKDINGDDSSSYDEASISANQLTEPFSSSSSDGDGAGVHITDKKERSDKSSFATTPFGDSRKKALSYQKELRQLQNGENMNSSLHFEKVYLYIQMQLCRKDTLKDWLRTNCDNRDKTTLFDLFYQIVDAVEYVHSQDLIHRDLKPSNIFFSLDGTLKIGDFGLCRAKTNAGVGSSLDLQEYVAESEVERGFDAVHTEQVGTQLYMSPEQLNGLSYNQKVDIFAMGLILLELLIPFKTQMQRVNVLFKARNNLYSEEFKQEHPQEYELVKCLLSRSPQKRPTATEIKQHDLLANAQLSQPVIERIYHRRRTISSNSSTE